MTESSISNSVFKVQTCPTTKPWRQVCAYGLACYGTWIGLWDEIAQTGIASRWCNPNSTCLARTSPQLTSGLKRRREEKVRHQTKRSGRKRKEKAMLLGVGSLYPQAARLQRRGPLPAMSCLVLPKEELGETPALEVGSELCCPLARLMLSPSTLLCRLCFLNYTSAVAMYV